MYDQIRKLCKQRQISVGELEEKAGIAQRTICRWDKSSPSIDKVIKVADYLGVTLDELCGRDVREFVADNDDSLRITRLGNDSRFDFKILDGRTGQISYLDLSFFESNQYMINIYDRLNDDGKDHVIAVMEGLSVLPKYAKRK